MFRKNGIHNDGRATGPQTAAASSGATEALHFLTLLFISICFSLLFSNPSVAAEDEIELHDYKAEYEAQIKNMDVHMFRTMAVTGKTALITNKLKKLIFALQESSHVEITPNHKMKALHFKHERKNLGDRYDRDLVFDWDKNVVTDKLHPENEPLAIEFPIYDKISYQEQLRLDLLKNPDAERFEYKITAGKRIRDYAFQRIGEEQIETPLGKLNAVKFKRDRGENSKRETYIWFAKDWNYLLARLDQIVEKGGKAQRMELVKANINGEEMKGL